MTLRRLRSTNEGWLTSYADLITNLLLFFVLMIAASHVQTSKMEKIAEALSGEAASESLESASKKVKQALEEQKLSQDVSVQMTDEGLEIAFNSGVTFASGQANILPSMETPMAKVLAVVKPYAEKYHLAVEGHTDEVPIRSGAYKSNWELSSARAMQIREHLETVGVAAKRIRVEAYADTKPFTPEKGVELDRNTLLGRQRRVVIRLY
ncbi:MAG: OmpA family protein [Proteobacteria bacterium]|nr:OmpA family protein [Pseudomonadota bacterium]